MYKEKNRSCRELIAPTSVKFQGKYEFSHFFLPMSIQSKSLPYSTLCINYSNSFHLHYHYPTPNWITVYSCAVFHDITL